MSSALNVTTAAFGGLREVTTSPLWQWDYGQILQITGLDLPQAFEVHFSNSRKSGETVTQIGTDNQVVIPDMYLTSGADVYCFIFLHDGADDGETEYVIKIPVRERPEPSDIEPTPVQQDAITQAIAALNDAVEQTGEDKEATAALAEAAAASSLVATEAAQSAQGSATSASGSATTATNAAQTATTKASEAATSAASAASAKTAAETAETNAKAAQTASESAQASAASAAQTATSKAAEASTSATSASGSATAASASASQASESATSAAASATTASESATSAATSASTASTKASEASASAIAAQTAQTAAETAAATFETDTTLTVAGKAADAKVVGDAIDNLNYDVRHIVNQTTLTPELQNLRVLSAKIAKNNNFRSIIVPVEAGKTYTVEIDGDINRNIVYGITDDTWDIGTQCVNLEYTPQINTRTSNYSMEITIPSGYKYLLITLAYSTATPFAYEFTPYVTYKTDNNPFSVMGVPVVTLKQYEKDHPSYEDKYISILGDSISALAGTLPTGNEAYYTGSNYGINSADDMWWKIVADKLGMNVLVNNSWSGSQVCERTPGTKIPASYPSRCQALHTTEHNPDYVLIAMGVNDYSYNSLLGDWNGQTMPVDDTDFTQSYALMINRINSAYPNAKIICISPWFVQRGTDTGITYVNTQTAHLTESAYGNAIKKLCEMLGAIYIDSYVGFNKFNYYPTYCEDSETTPTHPNKNGQSVMGNVIAEKIRTLIF